MGGMRLMYGGPPREDADRVGKELAEKIFGASCSACSSSRILWGPEGAEPCPVCCGKLRDAQIEARRVRLNVEAVKWRDDEQRALATRRENERLRAKVNRLLRKLRGVRP